MRWLNLSRRAARRLLDTRRVFVNGRRVWIAHHRIQDGDRIEVPVDTGEAPLASIPILYEDAELLVVNKPAGLVTTGEVGVEGRLRRERAEADLIAVHRLDRGTTGCLLIARSRAARERMVDEFRAGRVRKWYRAIAIGRWEAARTEIRTPLEGQTAITRVRRMAATQRASLLHIEIATGRTHQIRRHLMGLGHPVAGDPVYGAGVLVEAELRVIPRPMLHAERIEFVNAEGRTVEVTAPLPSDFCTAVQSLGLARRQEKRA